MKKSFLNDLADERIPLNSPKFAKSVPHGMKGQDLLEMLWTRRIGVDRAVWLVQVLGAHDVASRQQMLHSIQADKVHSSKISARLMIR